MLVKTPFKMRNKLSAALQAALLVGLTLSTASAVADGETTRLSVSNSKAEPNERSWRPAISADNRYVVFQSLASNLVENDTNGILDVFVRDRLTNKVTRVNVASDGTQALGGHN